MTCSHYALYGGFSQADLADQQAAYLNAISVRAAQIKALPQATTFGEIVGWRAWRINLDTLTLMSLHYDDWHWVPGENKASAPPSGSPDAGLHAHKSMQGIFKQEGPYWAAIGTILMWGDVVEHEAGYRAEFAKVESLRLFRPGGLTEDQRVKLLDKYTVD